MNLNHYLSISCQLVRSKVHQWPGAMEATLRSGGAVWMVLSTLLNVAVWAYAGTVAAQTSPFAAVASVEEQDVAPLSRMVVFRPHADAAAGLAEVRLNDMPLTRLEQGSYAVICLPPQRVQFTVHGNGPAPQQHPFALSLRAGENHYIQVQLAQGPQKRIDEPALDRARHEILKLSLAAPTVSQAGLTQSCTTDRHVLGQVLISDADLISADSKAQ